MDKFTRDSYIKEIFDSQLTIRLTTADLMNEVSDMQSAVAKISENLTYLMGFVMGAQSARSGQQQQQEQQSLIE